MGRETVERQVANDLIDWTERSGFVYEQEEDGVYATQFSDDGEPVRRYKVSISLEEI